METEFWLQVMMRALPAIVVFGLAFIVAADKKSRERWAEWMYQLGNVRHDQRDDPKVQRGVRLPFFVASALLLVIPIRFYWQLMPTRNVEFVPQVNVAPRPTPAPENAAPADRSTPASSSESTAAPLPTPPAQSGPIGIQ